MAKEYLKALSGTDEEKRVLFNLFMAKLLNNEQLSDVERPMFEYLKIYFVGDSDGV